MPAIHQHDDHAVQLARPARKRSHVEMKSSRQTRKWIDEETYLRKVLRLPPNTAEGEVEEDLAREARELGIIPAKVATNIESITSSLSATTVSSDLHQGSIISQSTAPTSCASSEHRPATSLSNASTHTPSDSAVPSILSDIEKKRYSGLRSGFRKMAGFRKRRSIASVSASLTSIESEAVYKNGDRTSVSIKSPAKSPSSVKSGNSYFSNNASTAKTSYEPETIIDSEALQRSLDCKDMLDLRSKQLDEKSRFLDYQTALINLVRAERDRVKAKKVELQRQKIDEQEEKNEKAVEELEARQLEEELKIVKEHNTEKRAIMTRLRYMEAYCQNPTPPPSPADGSSEKRSIESTGDVPERQITQQHYENLAQQYHRRDTMDDLHTSKINVLRGKQKRTVENLMLKKDRDIEQLEREQEKELETIDLEYGKQEADIRSEFESKRPRLETRWRLQAIIEKTKMEQITGLKYEGLPDVVAMEGRA